MEEKKSVNKIGNIITCVIFLGFIFIFSIVSIILPDNDFSEDENRMLKTMPSLSSEKDASLSEKLEHGTLVDRLLDGSFTADFASYLSDQFPARTLFTEVKAISELSIGKKENADVTLAKDGMLIRRNRNTPDSDRFLSANLKAIASFREKLESDGIDSVFAVAPRQADLFAGSLTGRYPKSEKDRVYGAFDDDTLILSDAALSEHTDEYIYYRTDHHWTTLGAYYAYRAIIPELSAPAIPLSDFRVETVSEEFYGTSYSKSGFRFVAPDTMEYFIYGNEDEFTTTIEDDGKSYSGFYDRSYLEGKDKYSSFISGNHGIVTVKKAEEERKTLAVVKDSFAHSLVPFLAQSFDLVIVDTRYYHLPVADLIKERGADSVLILCGADTLTEGTNFVSLGANL